MPRCSHRESVSTTLLTARVGTAAGGPVSSYADLGVSMALTTAPATAEPGRRLLTVQRISGGFAGGDGGDAGQAAPIVTALTVAVTEAAERLSERSRLGRLPIPMVLVLDEAANVCRWTELPNLYSHFGSRGIVVLTMLQSWAQGTEVWGREGMIKLWAAA